MGVENLRAFTFSGKPFTPPISSQTKAQGLLLLLPSLGPFASEGIFPSWEYPGGFTDCKLGGPSLIRLKLVFCTREQLSPGIDSGMEKAKPGVEQE